MKTRILSVAFTGAFALAALGGTALAASDNHADEPIPGDKNCQGQAMAYLAQFAQNNDLEILPGFKNLADAFDLSIKEYRAIVADFCAGGPEE